MQLVVEDFESMAPVILNPSGVPMTDDEFVAFCQQYEDCSVECTAEGEIIIMPPSYSKTGEQNSEIIIQLGMWAKERRAGKSLRFERGFSFCPMAPAGRRTPPGFGGIGWRRCHGNSRNASTSCVPISSSSSAPPPTESAGSRQRWKNT